jgi:iron complex outermembrane recepter protein
MRLHMEKMTLAAAVSTAVLGIPKVMADDMPGFAIEEIVVTAQRREQSLQDVPIAVSAYDQEFLKDAGVKNINDVVSYTPGLSGTDQGLSTPQYAIRGISSNSFGVGGEASVGVFVDDTYSGRITVAGLAFIDAARVEVLKGPQGTLFGRNTSAGAISVTSNHPNNEMSLDISQKLGNYGQSRTTMTGNMPIIEDVLAVRASLVYDEGDGFVENETLGKDFGSRVHAGKLALLYTPTENLDVLFSYTTQDAKTGGRAFEPQDSNNLYATLAGLSDADIDLYDDEVFHGTESFEKTVAESSSLRVTWDINPNLSLTSISSYQEYTNEVAIDVDGTPANVLTLTTGDGDENGEAFGQEFRLNGESGDIIWMLGTSYFKENVSQVTYNHMDENIWDLFVFAGLADSGVPGLEPILADLSNIATANLYPNCPANGGLGSCDTASELSVDASGNFESFAVYTDMTWALTDQLNINAGLRYSRDSKDWNYAGGVTGGNDLVQQFIDTTGFLTAGAIDLDALVFNGTRTLASLEDTQLVTQSLDETWTSLAPRLAIDYAVNEDLMVYSSIARGYKSGGFDTREFDAEESWSYELGFKSTLWDGRMQLNGSFYYYDYENFQVFVTKNSQNITESVPEMTGKGAEFEMVVRPAANLDIIATLAYNDSEFKDFSIDSGSLKGNSPAYSPKETASIVGRYTADITDGLELVLQGEASYQGDQYFTLDNAKSRSQSGYSLFNARVALVDKEGVWELALYGRNLGDKEFVINSFDPLVANENLVQRGVPRLVGAEVFLHF